MTKRSGVTLSICTKKRGGIFVVSHNRVADIPGIAIVFLDVAAMPLFSPS